MNEDVPGNGRESFMLKMRETQNLFKVFESTKQKMEAKTPQWSGLGRDLLEKIAKLLNTRTDVLHFRAVCTTWRSSTPPSNNHFFPLNHLPFPIAPNRFLNPKRHGHFSLTESTVFCVEPLTKISDPWNTTKTWLVKIEDATESNKVRLKEPLSNFPFQNLTKSLPKVMNLLDYRVSEIAKAYNLEFVDEMKSVMFEKVAVSSNKDDDFAVMAMNCGKLSAWKMGDKKWTCIDDGRERAHYDDICYHKGKFYAVDLTGLTICVDSSLKITKVALPMPSSFGRDGINYQYKHLVKSGSELLLVEKYVDIDVEFEEEDSEDEDEGSFPIHLKVYKLNEEEIKEWVPVESLGDRVLFVGDDCSFSVSVKDCFGCKGNCVYFTEDCFSKGCEGDHPGFDTGLFDLEDQCALSLSDCAGYSKLFWPPPTWLKNKPCSSGS